MARLLTESSLRRRNIWKVTRTVLQFILILMVVLWVVWSLSTAPKKVKTEEEIAENRMLDDGSVVDAAGNLLEDAVGIIGINNAPQVAVRADSVLPPDAEPAVRAKDGARFICVSYNGVNTNEKLESKIVNVNVARQQLELLAKAGYVTITQEDVLNYYNEHQGLPENSLLLVFEDGIYNTAKLVQPILEQLNYKATMCTYSGNLTDHEDMYITAEDINNLLETSFWEIGSNGYRLSYINVFDRYRNYFGHLNLKELVAVREHLRRDYNHYLMDFLRDKDRLREETEEEMIERISWDYRQMREDYMSATGFVPALYILMHSNTRAFGNDQLVSYQNEKELTELFQMNINRQGTCLNTLDSLIWDLSRLESRHYFSPNHLMMRIWDDTGDNVYFMLGDEEAASHWDVSGGVADFEGDRIILTTMPYGTALMQLKDQLPTDPDITVTLQGNVVGKQGVIMHATADGTTGIAITLENNYHVVRSMADQDMKLFEMNLFEFDGGPFISKEEDELQGLIALQQAIIDFDDDPERVREAQAILPDLEAMTVVSIEEGGEPYYPDLDISQRDERKLRVRLAGNGLSVWLDDQLIVEDMRVPVTPERHLLLIGAVSEDIERFSRENLDDDVYDAVFINLTINDLSKRDQEPYAYTAPDAYAEADETVEEDAVAEPERPSFWKWLIGLVGLG